MASEIEVPPDPEPPQQTLVERLINSRNRDLSLFLPFIIGINTISTNSQGEDVSSTPRPRPSRDRLILVNPITQGMVVIEGSPASLDSLVRDILNKHGQPPASRVSIEAMPRVEVGVDDDDVVECVICLEECGVGVVVKEMPCKHRFHEECIEKWLKIHGLCPVCRYKMPVDDFDELSKKLESREEGRRREIWVSFSFSGDDRRRSSSIDRTVTSPSSGAMATRRDFSE